MSKERLEEVKDIYQSVESLIELGDFKQADIAMCYLVENFGKWLIKQAERVQELETTVDFYQSALRDADRRVQELEEENVILKATRAGNEEHIDVLHKQNKYLKNEIQKLRKQLKQK